MIFCCFFVVAFYSFCHRVTLR